MTDTADLTTLTADVVTAYVGNNSIALHELAGLIGDTYAAFAGLGAAVPELRQEKSQPAVSARKSLGKPDVILSMIDGKPYKTLRKHVGRHGYTPESYREAFGLPADYPMVAPAYAAMRRELAKKFGLGRKKAAVEVIAPEPESEEAPQAPRRGRRGPRLSGKAALAMVRGEVPQETAG